MTDHFARPDGHASSPKARVDEEHRLAREDYASTAPLRQLNPTWPTGVRTAAEAPYDPLHAPDRTLPKPADLDTEIATTLRILDETASLNIHDNADMQQAASSLSTRLRVLLAAIQAERGEGR